MVFLAVLSGYQGLLVHLIGRFICGIMNRTPSHNRIFRLLGKEVGYQLLLVLESGLIYCLQMEESYHLIVAELAIIQMYQ